VTTPVIVKVKVKPELAGEMKLLLKKILPDTKAFDGFISIDVCHNLDSIGEFVFYEQWKSRRHYEKYFAWRTETGVIEQMTAMSVEPPTISYFELVE
jgi:quinol monooxygenase YgiN